MDNFEKWAGELMEEVCDRCAYPTTKSLDELSSACAACPIQPQLALALASQYRAGRSDAIKQIMEAVVECTRQ